MYMYVYIFFNNNFFYFSYPSSFMSNIISV